MYGLLAGALEASGKVGVGKVVMRDREDMVLIGQQEGGLVIYKVRYPEFLRSIGDVPDTEQVDVAAEELKLAQSLVDSMTTSFADIEMKDSYREAVKELIDAKVEGQEIVAVAEEVKPVVDIMSALKESIEQAKTVKKPMERAEGEKAEAKAEKKAPARKKAAKKPAAKARKVA